MLRHCSPVVQHLAVRHLHCPRLLEPCLDAAECLACVSPGLNHGQIWSHLAVRAVPTPPLRQPCCLQVSNHGGFMSFHLEQDYWVIAP